MAFRGSSKLLERLLKWYQPIHLHMPDTMCQSSIPFKGGFLHLPACMAEQALYLPNFL